MIKIKCSACDEEISVTVEHRALFGFVIQLPESWLAVLKTQSLFCPECSDTMKHKLAGEGK
jgi:hypothetical protein